MLEARISSFAMVLVLVAAGIARAQGGLPRDFRLVDEAAGADVGALFNGRLERVRPGESAFGEGPPPKKTAARTLIYMEHFAADTREDSERVVEDHGAFALQMKAVAYKGRLQASFDRVARSTSSSRDVVLCATRVRVNQEEYATGRPPQGSSPAPFYASSVFRGAAVVLRASFRLRSSEHAEALSATLNAAASWNGGTLTAEASRRVQELVSKSDVSVEGWLRAFGVPDLAGGMQQVRSLDDALKALMSLDALPLPADAGEVVGHTLAPLDAGADGLGLTERLGEKLRLHLTDDLLNMYGAHTEDARGRTDSKGVTLARALQDFMVTAIEAATERELAPAVRVGLCQQFMARTTAPTFAQLLEKHPNSSSLGAIRDNRLPELGEIEDDFYPVVHGARISFTCAADRDFAVNTSLLWVGAQIFQNGIRCPVTTPTTYSSGEYGELVPVLRVLNGTHVGLQPLVEELGHLVSPRPLRTLEVRLSHQINSGVAQPQPQSWRPLIPVTVQVSPEGARGEGEFEYTSSPTVNMAGTVKVTVEPVRVVDVLRARR